MDIFMNDEKKILRPRSEKLLVQERDIVIFKFLDRIGYANVEQITRAVGLDGGEKAQQAIIRRLYLLRRFEYLKVFSTQKGNYYALTNKSKVDNALISTIKLDQLRHHDFLTELFFVVQSQVVLSERECIAQFKIVGKKGKVPDMVINDWIIEYERTNKSAVDCKAVIDHWTSEKGKNLCVIYESEEIKNRYALLLNPRVRLLSSQNYSEVLSVLFADDKVISESNAKGDYLGEIKSKYL